MPIEILMPALSPTMTEGTLARWHKAEGDSVVSGDLICEIETDKATMEVEAVDEGTLARIVVTEGSEGVPVNQVIAVLLEEGEDATALANISTSPPALIPTPAAAPESVDPVPVVATPAPSPATGATSERIFASPLARRLAQAAEIELGTLSGSGPHGRIVKRDIEAAPTPVAATTPAASPLIIDDATLAPYREVPHSTMRKIVASRLTLSKQTIPHFYLSVDCELDNLLKLRKDLNDRSDDSSNYKLSVNDFIIRAVALALVKVPEANAMWGDTAMRVFERVDVSVAVAIPGGLITPVIRDAGSLGLLAISNQMKDLAVRAREGKLMPEEYQGGAFTISNLGMMGIKSFSAIINPPQACILAVGTGEQRPVVRDGTPGVATVMSCTLAVDHRVVDGAVGAEFLGAFKPLIENPVSMLL